MSAAQTARIAAQVAEEWRDDPFGKAREIPVLRPVPLPDDVTDAETFPEIHRAREHARTLLERTGHE